MLAPGTVLQDRYRVAGPIGKGGMGAVYQARDLRLRCDVALKETLFTDETYRKAFEREAQMLARLRHQHLPRVLDHFLEGHGQFLVMEYIPGEDLGTKLARLGKQFASAQALPLVLRWADQLLDVLYYLHTRPLPIFHRDIKPKNLKLTQTYDIILLDFGLARGGITVSMSDIEDSATTTPEGANRKVYGFTPPYAPFEQMRDGEPDARSDIYSLAATLYHMLTGALPPDAMGRMARLINGQPDSLRPIRDLSAHVPVPVAQLIERGLSVMIEQRPQTAREMREQLAQARGLQAPRLQVPPQAPPPAPPPRTPATSVLPAVTMPQVIADTPSSETLPIGTLVRRLITGSPIRSVAFSPSGQILAAGYDDHTAGLFSLADYSQLHTLRGHTSSVRSIAFSPRGGIFATGSDDETLRIWQVGDGSLRQSLRMASCPIESICFSPQGDLLAVGGWGSAVTLFKVDGANLEPIGSLICPFVHSLSFSADGSLLAAGCYDGAVYLWRTSDHHLSQTIAGFTNFIYSVGFSPDGQLLAASSHTSVKVWRLSDSTLIETLQGHTGPVRSLSFSPDSQLLITASEDKRVRFWRLSDEQITLTLDHSAGVASVGYSPDGRLLASGTHDGRIYLWKATM